MSPIDRSSAPNGGGTRGAHRAASKKNSTGTIAAIVVVLVLGGFAAWKFLPSKDVAQLTESARQTLNALTDDAGSNNSATASDPGVPGAAGKSENSGGTMATGADSNAASTALNTGESLPVTDFSGETTSADGASSPLTSTTVGPLTVQGLNANGTTISNNIVEAPEGVEAPVLVTEPDSATLAAQTPRPDHVDKALGGQLSTAAQTMTQEDRDAMPTVGSRLGDFQAPNDAGRGSDSVVSSLFIRDLAHWLVNSYQLGKGSAPGRTSVTIVSANLRYGNNLTGLRFAGKDPVAGRKSVLDYVYSPGMMEGLFRLYGNLFLDEMAVAIANRKQPLNNFQAADLYNLYAGLFHQVEGALRGISRLPNLSTQLKQVQDSSQNVIRANSQFAEALFLFEEARDAGNKTEAERYQQHVVQKAHTVETSIQGRAAARRALADAIRSNATGRTPSEDSLIYLAEWVDRRGPNKSEATGAAADIMRRLAIAFEAEARLWIRNGEEVL